MKILSLDMSLQEENCLNTNNEPAKLLSLHPWQLLGTESEQAKQDATGTGRQTHSHCQSLKL